MLKYWLAILLVLNAAVLAWQLDAFARWGHGPNQHREPERLQQQIKPEALKFEVPAKAERPAATEATASTPAQPEAMGSQGAEPSAPAPTSATAQ
jgi:hypothetical protein